MMEHILNIIFHQIQKSIADVACPTGELGKVGKEGQFSSNSKNASPMGVVCSQSGMNWIESLDGVR